MARDVQARIEVTAPGVEIQGPKAVGVGTIPPNGQGVARFKLRLLRSVPAGELPVALTVTQADFPAVSDTLRVDVRQEQVKEERVVAAPLPSAPTPRQQRPIITLGTPRHGQIVHGERIELAGTVVDEKGISQVHVVVNDKPLPEETVRQGLRRQPSDPGSTRDQRDLIVPVQLRQGQNTITVTAYNVDNEREQITRTVTREDRPQIGGATPILAPHSDVDQYVVALGPGQADLQRWAVIIGIENYQKYGSAPNVVFAIRDAIAMRGYAVKVLGVPPENIVLLLDDQATKSAIQVILEDRLQQRLRVAKTMPKIVYVYFAGHGLPAAKADTPEGKDIGYLLPYDGDPQSPRISGYSLEAFYTVLGQLSAERVVIFLDACFSGYSARQDQPQLLLAGARFVERQVEDPVLASQKLVSFAAARRNQVSNAYTEKAHGLFTYFLLKGLSGDAVQNKDGRLKLVELAEYVKDHVSRRSRQLFGEARQQTPVTNPPQVQDREVVLKER